jgi:hypothetical protein
VASAWLLLAENDGLSTEADGEALGADFRSVGWAIMTYRHGLSIIGYVNAFPKRGGRHTFGLKAGKYV